MHAELARFIRRSAHHGAISAPRDDHGLAAELRIVALLYGRIERVHIDVDDLASFHLATILRRSGRRFLVRCGNKKAEFAEDFVVADELFVHWIPGTLFWQTSEPPT